MGGCATKPKVMKGDEVANPVPAPETTKENIPAAVEVKDVADDEGQKKVESENNVDEVVKDRDIEIDDTPKDVVDDDDQANKRRSLSNLFQEKEKKGSAESDNTPVEKGQQETAPVQQDSPEQVKEESVEPANEGQIETEKPNHTSEIMNQETEKPANPIEQTSEQYSGDAPGKVETEKPIEAIPVAEPATGADESQNKETAADVKEDKTEVAK